MAKKSPEQEILDLLQILKDNGRYDTVPSWAKPDFVTKEKRRQTYKQ